MSARSSIVDKLVSILSTMDGIIVPTNMYGNVTKRLVFWDEVTDFPHISVVAGPEQREYLPGNFKWATLTVNLKIYVSDEDPVASLEQLLQDIEILIDDNNSIEYATGLVTQDVRLVSIETDEGLLAPYGVGDVSLQILYEVQH